MSPKPPTFRVEVKQERAFRYLWLKYVHGFNPSVHCARCLLGKFSKQFEYTRGYVTPKIVTGLLDEHPGPWYYLCGVTNRWAWNVHIVGQSDPGSIVRYEDDRIKVNFDGFKQLAIDASHSPDAPKEFATCRNWQFGWQAYPESPWDTAREFN